MESERKLAVRVDGSKAIENAPGALRQFMGELGAGQFVGERAWWAQVGKRKHFRKTGFLIRFMKPGTQRKSRRLVDSMRGLSDDSPIGM